MKISRPFLKGKTPFEILMGTETDSEVNMGRIPH